MQGDLGWFDLTSSFAGAPVRALLSQADGVFVEASLAEHRDSLACQLGLLPERIAVPHQVHGASVEQAIPGRVHRGTDGLFTADSRVVLTLQVADCAPVFFLHSPSRTRGLVHAGWRGLAVGILTAGVGHLESRGVDPGGVEVTIGPMIEMACYEVGPEVVEHFHPSVWRPNSNGRFQLDLRAAVREQLVSAGISEVKIAGVDVCTHCDPRCHSYRRDGQQAGRMVAFFYVDGGLTIDNCP